MPCNCTAQALTRLIGAESSSKLTCQATAHKEGRYLTRAHHKKKHIGQATRSFSETKRELTEPTRECDVIKHDVCKIARDY